MGKFRKWAAVCLVLAVLTWVGGLVSDHRQLGENLIRLHVVAASDSREDQARKLLVRDAVVEYLETELAGVEDMDRAKDSLRRNLPRIQRLANRVLKEAGSGDTARVTLLQEEFDTRHYDTFSLPSGVYESLRITIGEGTRQNWWCVVFPSLCLSATAEGFEQIAGEAGIDEALACALAGEEGYELRFYLLDVLGKLENIFHAG